MIHHEQIYTEHKKIIKNTNCGFVFLKHMFNDYQDIIFDKRTQ